MKNNVLKFKEALLKAESILIVSHISLDGDAVGSCAALYKMLEHFGKKPTLCSGEPIPKKYGEFGDLFEIVPETDRIFDMVIYVDCGEESRANVEFPKGKTSCTIDHHISNTGYGDINIIDPEAPATGEIIFEMFDILGIPLDNYTAYALYMAILTDTGGFLFSNTRKRTHEVTAMLYDYDFPKHETAKKVLLEKSLTSYKLTAKIFENIYLKDDVAIGYIDYETYTKYNVTSEDTDGLSNSLRNIEGINCGILLTEKEKNFTKGSIRTDDGYDANEIASHFGGGGHLRAAGFSVSENPLKVKEQLNEWLFTHK